MYTSRIQPRCPSVLPRDEMTLHVPAHTTDVMLPPKPSLRDPRICVEALPAPDLGGAREARAAAREQPAQELPRGVGAGGVDEHDQAPAGGGHGVELRRTGQVDAVPLRPGRLLASPVLEAGADHDRAACEGAACGLSRRR